MFINPIGGKALQVADRHRTIELSSIAFLFTRMVANTPYRGGKGIIFFDYIKGFFISAGLDQSNVALRTCLRRTGVFAGTGSSFGDQKSIGDRLRIRPVNGSSLIQPLVKFIRQENRTNLCTIITTRAFTHLHIAGMLSNLRFEMPDLSFQRDQLGVGGDFDIEMSSCLDQLWRDNAHGAVIGGEGLIELGHLSTDRRGAL